MRFSLAKRLDLVVALAVIVASACGGGAPVVTHSPSSVQGALSEGLIAYLSDKGVGVLDPMSGKSTLVAPLPAGGAFRVSGPVWAPAPGVPYPVLYFTIHDDRPAESRTTPPGVIPYDWLFRADPFAGTVEPLAASADLQSEGPFGLVANARYLALTTGCCANYEVDALDLTRPSAGLKVLAKPPTQAALFTEGAAPGPDGLIAVRVVGTGAWYWLNASAAVLNPFPLTPGPEDGPIAISADGTLAAISLPDQGPIIEPINVATPVASPSPVTSGTAAPAATPTHASPVPSAAPRHVNSKLPHADGLAWSPDAKQLALAVNGEIEIYAASGADGAVPVGRYLTGGNILGGGCGHSREPTADQGLPLAVRLLEAVADCHHRGRNTGHPSAVPAAAGPCQPAPLGRVELLAAARWVLPLPRSGDHRQRGADRVNDWPGVEYRLQRTGRHADPERKPKQITGLGLSHGRYRFPRGSCRRQPA